MAYIETALVSSAGKLLIQLDDGTVIDAGRVQGPQGPAGRDGRDGERGLPGAKGRDGTDGARILTGLGRPDKADGANGDLYLDVQSATLELYQKVGGQWLILAALKQSQGGGGGGGQTAAGGGGAIIIYPMPDGGTPPSADNNGKPIDKGDLWYDPNTGWIWVYDGTNWLAIGDRPPVIISPTPPIYNNASDGVNTKYPVKEGDLWFDSEQLALYVAAEDAGGQLVWIISTPANRSGVSETVSNPFVFPVAVGGETVYNPTSDTWYVWNEHKTQWIDVPTNCQTTDYVYKGEGADPEKGEFKIGFGSTPELAEIYLFGDKRPFLKDGGYLFINDVSHTIISVNYSSATNTTVVAITPGLENLVLDDSYNFSSCAPFIEKQEVYYGEQKPTEEDDDLEVGNIWIDKEDNKLYVWDGFVWSEVTACSALGVGDYVLKAGDTMSGPLVMDNAGEIEMINTTMEMRRTMPNDGTGNWDANRSRYGIIKSRLPRIIEPDGSETLASGDAFGIEIDLSDRNTYRNELKITKKDDDIVRVTSGANPQVVFNANIDRSNMPDDKGIPKGVAIFGIPTPDKDLTPSNYVANKEYVDQREAYLQNEIIELAEEINALSPVLERGLFISTAGATGPGEGEFFIRNAAGKTIDYADETVNNIIISKKDKDGGEHTFVDVVVGDLLHLFEEGPDNGLYKITGVAGNSSPTDPATAVTFDVEFISGNGEATVGDVARLRISKPPSGGDASEFVAKAGDIMSGKLTVHNDILCSGELAGNDGTDEVKIGAKFDLRNAEIKYSSTVIMKYDSYGFTKLRFGNTYGNAGEVPVRVAGSNYMEYKNILDFSQYQELS